MGYAEVRVELTGFPREHMPISQGSDKYTVAITGPAQYVTETSGRIQFALWRTNDVQLLDNKVSVEVAVYSAPKSTKTADIITHGYLQDAVLRPNGLIQGAFALPGFYAGRHWKRGDSVWAAVWCKAYPDVSFGRGNGFPFADYKGVGVV